ncbi:hypothetical protein [Leifsonia sp. Leaf264]|uniref:hypothetical protein n=1 Tax=Leifsonia sp. Leaf264 TaxID=1736314 RepID=UPI0006F96DFA|nr:hypothetical protein [Leifsonia sp. Leaf264]KQO98889.1 hypothetical protein ASF30_12570 [Leifsonia sp. Leaf264]
MTAVDTRNVYRIEDAAAVRGLAAELTNPSRHRVAVVVTCPSEAGVPRFNPNRIAAEIGSAADVYLITSRTLAYTFSDEMPLDVSVYGGAARVYPTGDAWIQNWRKAPIVLAYDEDQAEEKTHELVDAAITASYLAPEYTPTPAVRRAAPAAPSAPAKPSTPPPTPAALAARLGAAPVPKPAPAPAPVPTPKPAPVAPAPTPAPTLGLSPAATPAPSPATVAAAPTASPVEAVEAVEAVEVPTPQGPTPAERRTALQAALTTVHNLKSAATAASLAHAAELSELRVENARLNRTIQDRDEVHRASARTKKPKPATAAADPYWKPEWFADPERTLRYAVTSAWAERVPSYEKDDYPLSDYIVGPAFSESIDTFDDGQRTKALRTIVDVITGRARTISGRNVHPLRTGEGGDDAPRTRDDGAICYRANIETNTSSARRLHFWKLPDGTVELSRVVLHEDMEP